MKTDFKNLLELLDYFKEESTCKELLALQRWAGAPVCPHCDSKKAPYITKVGYKCSDNKCYKKFSVTVGTIFHNSKIPLRLWFAAIYLCTAHKKGVSARQLARDLGVNKDTAWFMLHRVREMLKDKAPQMLTGIIECETLIGGIETNKHKHKQLGKHHWDKKVTVLGILERDGKVITQIVPNSRKVSLIPIMVGVVAPGSTIYTDEKLSYRSLSNDYTHDFTNHKSKKYVKGACHTNSVEGFWSLLKRGIDGIYHSVTPKHLQSYCNEYAYKYNTRKQTDNDRFFDTLARSGNFQLSYKELISRK